MKIGIGCAAAQAAAVVIVSCISTAAGHAAVIHVPADQPTIQAGVNAAAIGDTVSVAPGLYVENVSIVAKPLTLLGDLIGQTAILRADLSQAANYTNPAAATFLAKSDTMPVATMASIPSGGGTSPLILANSNSGVVEVAGLTIELGNAAPGFYCANSKAFIHHNVIRNNTGGGVLCSGGQRSTISDNLFIGNSTYAGGGAAMTGGASADLYDNEFRNNRAYLGAGIFCIDDAGHTISGNLFKGNYASGGGGGIYYYHGGVAEVTGNLFVKDTSDHGGGVDNSDRQNLHLTHNTFDGCVAGIGGGGGNAAWWANGAYIGGIFKNNIVVRTTSASGTGGSLGCDPNIVGTVAINFNDFHDNDPVDVFRFSAGASDIFVDPLHCDAANGDYHLSSFSPSAGTGEGGSDRGAFGVGCGPLDVEMDVMPLVCPNIIGTGTQEIDLFLVRPGAAAVNKPALVVAILGTKTFDASDVDPDEVEIGGLAPIRTELKDVSRPVDTRESACECTGKGPDGKLDLVMYFKQDDMIAALSPYTDGASKTVELAGKTKAGYPLGGSDCVIIKNGPTRVSPLASAGEKAEPEFGVHPNPFNAATVMGFVLPADQHVRIDVYDVLGRRAETLVNDFLTAGQHQVTWDAVGYPSGMYFARLVTSDITVTKKMVLMK